MSKGISRNNPQLDSLKIDGSSATRPPPTPLNIAGSAARMHSRDYIEIINVIYKDDYNNCCGKSHRLPKTRQKPIMRKTWKKLSNEDSEERRVFRESIRVSSSNTKKHHHIGSPPPNRQPHRQQSTPEQITQNTTSFLPDIYSSITISTPPSRRARPTSTRVDSASHRTKSAHINTNSRSNSGTKDSKHTPPCGCHEGLIYLRKTHEWQNLLNEYRHEILKLRDALKEKEKALQNKKMFKRSVTHERRDNLNDILKEHRFNSYHVMRMRMEERMKHEHKVFERLSKRASKLHIDSTSDFNTSLTTDDTASISSQPVSSSSNSPDSMPLSTDEFSDHWKLLQETKDENESLNKLKINKQAKFPATITTITGNNHNTKYPGSLSRRNVEKDSVNVYSGSSDHHYQSSSHSNHQVMSHLEQNVASAPTRKPPRVVMRKRVVRCPCLKHKDG